MAKSNSWEVLWSPTNPNKFIRFNTTDANSDICLYQLFKDEDYLTSYANKNQAIKLNDSVHACPVATYGEYSSVKSIAWCPKKDLADYCVLAVGSSNGKLSLLNVGSQTPSACGLLLNQEFSPKADRTCHDIAWNTNEPNLIAVGLDKTRNDTSLLVWDVEAKSSMPQSPGLDNRLYGGSARKLVYEHGASETIVSVCWLPHMQRTLLAGGGTKWLRLYDMRVPQPKVIATTKAVYGVCVDPHNHNRIASFAEADPKVPQSALLVWDIRNHDKPLVTINQSSPVSKILWCPTRNHLLSVLQKDTKTVKYYDLQHLNTQSGPLQYSGGMDDMSLMKGNDSIPFERNAQLPKSARFNISSYSWHPSIENTILTISATGGLHYLKIFERITMSWSPSLDLVWGCGKHMLVCSRNATDMENEDISFVMRKRAILGYGEPSMEKGYSQDVDVKNQMKDEKKLREVLTDESLVKLWLWLKRSRKLKDHGTVLVHNHVYTRGRCYLKTSKFRSRSKKDVGIKVINFAFESRKIRKFFGVKSIIKGDLNNLESSQKPKHADKQSNTKGGRFTRSTVHEGNNTENQFAKVYTSDDRKLAMFLCDWDLDENALIRRLNKLAADGEPERAAAMALFANKLNSTISILSGADSEGKKTQSGSGVSLPVVAMALSGYSTAKQTLWASNCKALSPKLKNPYLRAIFAFLTTEDEDFSNVLKESDMELRDRIAFACRYLSDAKLTNYVENVTTSLITSGNLEGLLLTGLTSDGLDLLENFITKTSDIQTAILIIMNSKNSEVFKDARVANWIENYRDLLDKWRLWHERAHFDALVQSTDCSRKIPQQISVTCTYCSKPVSNNFMSSGMRMARFPHGSSRGNKAMSCPGCRQPLPRCSICLINMGSLSSHLPRQGPSKPKLDSVVNPFETWFTWCQVCRHGGHAGHLMEWFLDHLECPVTGCTCTCNALDSVAMLTPNQTTQETLLNHDHNNEQRLQNVT